MSTVILMRRHGPNCAAGYPQDSSTTEPEERRKGAKRCRCRIYAGGTLEGVYKKLATKARDWERAREVLAPYLAAGSWEPTQPPPPAGPTPDGTGRKEIETPPRETLGTAVGDAIQAFLRQHETSRSAANTITKYRQVLSQFERFSQELGLRYVEEWTRSYVRRLVVFWGESNSPVTVGKKLSVLKAFFEPLLEDEILAGNPARIKTRLNRAFREGTSSKQKNPFTDAELEQMFAACRARDHRALDRPVVAITDSRRGSAGEDLADFIEISYFTGLRISDVATFHVERLAPTGEVKVRATKNGNWISVWIPEWLQAVIRRRALIHGPLIFGRHSSTDTNVIADVWRRKLNRLWAKSGPWKEKPTHHRFRHTFVRILLDRGASLQLIAVLTGDTEQMIRKHYSAWMPSRQENVSRLLREAFQNVPRFSHC